MLWGTWENFQEIRKRTLLSILADLNAAVWIVSTCSLILMFSSPFTNLLEIFPSSPQQFSIVFLIFYFSSLTRSTYLFFFILFFLSTFIFLVWLRLGDLFVSQIQEKLGIAFSKMNSGPSIYHFFV